MKFELGLKSKHCLLSELAAFQRESAFRELDLEREREKVPSLPTARQADRQANKQTNSFPTPTVNKTLDRQTKRVTAGKHLLSAVTAVIRGIRRVAVCLVRVTSFVLFGKLTFKIADSFHHKDRAKQTRQGRTAV